MTCVKYATGSRSAGRQSVLRAIEVELAQRAGRDHDPGAGRAGRLDHRRGQTLVGLGGRDQQRRSTALRLSSESDRLGAQRLKQVVEDPRRLGLVELHLGLWPQQQAPVVRRRSKALKRGRHPPAHDLPADVIAQDAQQMAHVHTSVVVAFGHEGIQAIGGLRMCAQEGIRSLQGVKAHGAQRSHIVPGLLGSDQRPRRGDEVHHVFGAEREGRAAAVPARQLAQLEVQRRRHRPAGGIVVDGGRRQRAAGEVASRCARPRSSFTPAQGADDGHLGCGGQERAVHVSGQDARAHRAAGRSAARLPSPAAGLLPSDSATGTSGMRRTSRGFASR